MEDDLSIYEGLCYLFFYFTKAPEGVNELGNNFPSGTYLFDPVQYCHYSKFLNTLLYFSI